MDTTVPLETKPPQLRPGHVRALEQLERHDAYRETLAAYAQHLGPDSVYLRPTSLGLAVLSLDYETCAAMINVGAAGSSQHLLTTLPPSPAFVTRAVAGYRMNRSRMKRGSEEERFALRLMAHAFANGLRLPSSETYFLRQEWRFSGRSSVDMLGVNPQAGHLVVIELKRSQAESRLKDASKGGDALAQARGHAAGLHHNRAELYPYFARLARTLAQVHDGPASMQNLRLDAEHVPEAHVLFPT